MEAVLKYNFNGDEFYNEEQCISTDTTTSPKLAFKIENQLEQINERLCLFPRYNKYFDELIANYNNFTSFEGNLIKESIFEIKKNFISNIEEKKILLSNIEEIDDKDYYSIEISKRDWELILKNLEKPPEPTEYLIETMKKYKKGNKANHE